MSHPLQYPRTESHHVVLEGIVSILNLHSLDNEVRDIPSKIHYAHVIKASGINCSHGYSCADEEASDS